MSHESNRRPVSAAPSHIPDSLARVFFLLFACCLIATTVLYVGTQWADAEGSSNYKVLIRTAAAGTAASGLLFVASRLVPSSSRRDA